MTTRTDTKTTVAALAKQLLAGADKHFATATQVTFAGGSYTPAQITAKLNQVVTLRTDVDTAKAATQAKLAAETTDMPALRTFMSALVAYVKAVYGSQPDVLADFGVHPKVRTPLTVAEKAAAAAKRASTRKARNTMGSVQKKSVTGSVIGVTVTPITAGQPIVTPATPASPSTGASAPLATAAPAPRTP